jgi:hypothetical protein
MKKLLLLAFFLVIAGNALADVLCEGFPDPLGGWRDRWLAQNSTMTNVYVCGGNPDENNRGNNPCGLWICDQDQDFSTANIIFNPTFGATVSHFALEIVSFVGGSITFYDLNDNQIYQTTVINNGTFPPCPGPVYETDTPGGLGRFLIGPSGVEGNTSVDNVCSTVGPVPIRETTWGQIKHTYN